MYCCFGFFNYSQIIIIGAHFPCLLQVNPNIAINFFLLDFDIIGKRLRKEENNPFADFTERTIFADFSKSLFNNYIKSGFLFNFTNSRLMFVFAVLNMSLWKTPVSAVIVFYKQYFCVLFVFVKDNCTAGFFIKTEDSL